MSRDESREVGSVILLFALIEVRYSMGDVPGAQIRHATEVAKSLLPTRLGGEREHL